MLSQTIKVSIIIPVYHTEPVLKKCLESVLSQTWRNIEVILIDDGSNGGADRIVKELNDGRIRYIKHPSNKGLFSARITGIENATGDYIGFVDSDDAISIDYYHLLLQKACRFDADIVVGTTVFCEDSGKKMVSNLHRAAFHKLQLTGMQVQNAFFEQEGTCHSWHNVWNKLYSRELIMKCLPYLQKQDKHLIMGEDIIFSSLFMYYGQKLVVSPNAVYFYSRRSGSATGKKEDAISEKNKEDLKNAFSFVDNFLISVNATPKHILQFKRFYARYQRIWEINTDNEECTGEINDDVFFGLFEHEWGEGIETIKKSIVEGTYSYISFDVFDTAVVRPFSRPQDLFILLNKKFETVYKCNMNFARIRTNSEQGARKACEGNAESGEDISLEDIYNYMADFYCIPHDICDIMMHEEIGLEIEFSSARDSVKELYDVALLCGKKVIFVSDMYLPKETIESMLKKNGYNLYTNIYLSSAWKKLKKTGKLFDTVMEQEEIACSEILHLGDNEISDISIAIEKGINAYYMPDVNSLFYNYDFKFPVGKRLDLFETACGKNYNFTKVTNGNGIRSMFAIAAKEFFDNPYEKYESISKWDSNPYLFGYYVVGMHILGIVTWLDNIIRENGYRRVIFTARDGWCVMNAYRIWQQYLGLKADCQYIHVSRKSLLPAMITKETDLYNLPIEITQYSPQMLYELLGFCADADREPSLWSQLGARNIDRYERFCGEYEYSVFIKCFIETCYDERKKIEQDVLIREYLGNIRKHDIIFDMGYSGRIHKAIVDITGKNVDAAFIHVDNVNYLDNSRKGKFKIYKFWDIVPRMPDLLREHILSENTKGCIGYQLVGEKIVPIIECDNKNYGDRFVTNNIQRGAMDFIQTFLKYFAPYLDYLAYDAREVALGLEGFLLTSTAEDRKLFYSSFFEDSVYSGNPYNNIEEYIDEQYRLLHLS